MYLMIGNSKSLFLNLKVSTKKQKLILMTNLQVCIYGCIPFWIETKDLLHYGTTNKITVKVNNYRPVWMRVQEKVRILPEGVRITTLSHNPTEIQITTQHKAAKYQLKF